MQRWRNCLAGRPCWWLVHESTLDPAAGWTTAKLRLVLACLIGAALAACPARGEMSAGDYQAGSRRMSNADRARESARVAEEHERAAVAAQDREAEAAEQKAALQARRQAMPPGARLVEDRCTTCHTTDVLSAYRRGWLGWWAIVLRMEMLNGARIDSGERREIVAHLSSRQRGSLARTAAEWTVLLAVLGSPMVLGLWWRRR